MTEELLREDFIKWLKEEGCELLAKEIQLFPGSSIHDLIFLDKERKFICVEFKLTDWKKVIEQAERIRLNTPLVYIAMPLPATIGKRDRIQEIVKQKNLGLFWFNKYGKWTAHSAPSENFNVGQVDGWIEYFNKRVEQSLYRHFQFTFTAPYLGRAAEISKNVYYKTKKIIW